MITKTVLEKSGQAIVSKKIDRLLVDCLLRAVTVTILAFTTKSCCDESLFT